MNHLPPFSDNSDADHEKVNPLSNADSNPSPWIFRHRDLVNTLEKAKRVDQTVLMNRLNYLHFTDRPVLVHLLHKEYHEDLLMKAYPEPCVSEDITCRWADEYLSERNVNKYQFQNLLIDEDQFMILIPAVLRDIKPDRFTIRLPDQGYLVGRRQCRRYPCKDVLVELNQDGFQGKGDLLDFSALGFRVRIRPEPFCSFHGFDSSALFHVRLQRDEHLLFSEQCLCVRENALQADREIVLSPVKRSIRHFKKRRFRNLRQRLVPSPHITFQHPLSRKRVQLDIYDISTSGLSVFDDARQGTLVAGMLIPELMIHFPGGLKIPCFAQVIYGGETGDRSSKCGIVILDMNITNYSRLTDILINAQDPHSHVSTEVDLDELWEFFFDTGFIYPKKYGFIYPQRDEFKSTFSKLYLQSPEIAKHIVYHRYGKIQAHISMVRVYEKAWMIHHHAARSINLERAGIRVLRELMVCLNDMYRFPSANMDYALAFFRPESKFPEHVFGSFARSLQNTGGCSMDLFAYLSFPDTTPEESLPEWWSLNESSDFDLWELEQFYRHHSGGLLIDAFGIAGKPDRHRSLVNLYERFGLTRRLDIYSLKHEGELIAVLMLNQSNLGFNLSEILNSIQMLVIDVEGLPWDILSITLGRLAKRYKRMRNIPVLIYPQSYVDRKGIQYDRQYHVWILNVHYGDEYIEYMKKRFHIK